MAETPGSGASDGAGRWAYVPTMPRSAGRPTTVDIFEAAPESCALATVDEQRAWFDQWLRTSEECPDDSP
jgi:hypothetical protein